MSTKTAILIFFTAAVLSGCGTHRTDAVPDSALVANPADSTAELQAASETGRPHPSSGGQAGLNGQVNSNAPPNPATSEGVADGAAGTNDENLEVTDTRAGPKSLAPMTVTKGADGHWRTQATQEQLSQGTWAKKPARVEKPFEKQPGSGSAMMELEVTEVP